MLARSERPMGQLREDVAFTSVSNSCCFDVAIVVITITFRIVVKK
tara:strand:+ start:779 stop:913 length:135 start_codon:yes stop_codon:yes gene_type:complete